MTSLSDLTPTTLTVDAQSWARSAFSWQLGNNAGALERSLDRLSDEELTAVYLTAHRLAEAITDNQIRRFGFKPMTEEVAR